MSWREQCSPIIHEVLLQNKGKPEKEIKAALRAAYPFGLREMHPYKIWLDEIKKQRKLTKSKPENKKQIQLL